MTEENRVHPRFTVNQFVSISYDGESFIKVSAEDISQGGMSCKAEEAVHPLTNVYLILTIPTQNGDHVLKTEGKVVRCQEIDDNYLLGVKFSDLFESDKEVLNDYLSLLPSQ